MIRAFILICAVAAPSFASAQYYQQRQYGTGSNSNSHYVNPYTRNDGTQGGGYYRTNPNESRTDNYNAYGNHNPHNNTYGGQPRTRY